MNAPSKATPAPIDPVRRRIWIKGELERLGLSFAAVARQLDCRRETVSMVAAGHPSARIQEALAEAIGIPVASLFPERYDAKGNRTGRKRGSVAVTATQSITTRSDAGSGVKSLEAA